MGQCSCISTKKRSSKKTTSKSECAEDISGSYYEIVLTDERLLNSNDSKKNHSFPGNLKEKPNWIEEASEVKPLDTTLDIFSLLKYKRNALKRKTYAQGYLKKRKIPLKTEKFSQVYQEKVLKSRDSRPNKSSDSFSNEDSSFNSFDQSEEEVLKNFFISKNRDFAKQGTVKSKRLTGYHNSDFMLRELLSNPTTPKSMGRKETKESSGLSMTKREALLTRRPSISSFYNQDLESLSLSRILFENNPEDSILVFTVPFKKHVKMRLDYNFQTFNNSNFNKFYKTSEIRSETLKKNLYTQILELFPCRWNVFIPFVVDKELLFLSNSSNSPIYNSVMESFYEIQKNTVLRFVSYSQNKHESYLFFTLGPSNSSLVGRYEGKNSVTLKKNAKKADILHQIMHCLGFMHMHYKTNDEFFYYMNKDQIKSANLLPCNRNVCIFGVEFGPLDFNSVLYCNSCLDMISFVDRDDLDSLKLSTTDYAKINFFYDPRNFLANEEEIRELLEYMKEATDSKGQQLKLKLSLRNK